MAIVFVFRANILFVLVSNICALQNSIYIGGILFRLNDFSRYLYNIQRQIPMGIIWK